MAALRNCRRFVRWLLGTGKAVGGSIDIGLHEIGLSGEATVLAIGPCDVDSRETRPGMSIVTGTIRHRNATVWDLTFDDRTEEILGVDAGYVQRSGTHHVERKHVVFRSATHTLQN